MSQTYRCSQSDPKGVNWGSKYREEAMTISGVNGTTAFHVSSKPSDPLEYIITCKPGFGGTDMSSACHVPAPLATGEVLDVTDRRK